MRRDTVGLQAEVPLGWLPAPCPAQPVCWVALRPMPRVQQLWGLAGMMSPMSGPTGTPEDRTLPAWAGPAPWEYVQPGETVHGPCQNW